MKIIEIDLISMKIKKIIEIHNPENVRIEIHMKIDKTKNNQRNRYENQENHENQWNSCDNQENHENYRNRLENYENLKIQRNPFEK